MCCHVARISTLQGKACVPRQRASSPVSPSFSSDSSPPSPSHPPYCCPRTPDCRNIEQYPNSELIPGVLVARLDAPIYFANCNWMRHKLEEYEEEAHV